MTIKWEPHHARGSQTRVHETSCCGAYEWCAEGGQYFVLRHVAGRWEETGRGVYAAARQVWDHLLARHPQRCRRGKLLA
ncbi:hypothetical protein HII36_50805 [Nonomuraea sp. NN258]|uniref:hypothetical protein n=1 Tax=Nonomuraea antri TaxID=2730852 RepID=UPI0015699D6C|nr:hypothetical protein [Nonomuraea antri]NRQ40063.1 hypothetical protein [Nonomuraea antri]